MAWSADSPLAQLSLARALIPPKVLVVTPHVYMPPKHSLERQGGDLDDPTTLTRILPSAAADSEVMLLCLGGAGALRIGSNLVLSFRAMRLYHMLVLAPDKPVCLRLWEVLPDVACVWWPSQWSRPRPASLYNDNFPRQALALYEARKVLLECLVLEHRLNVLHLDGDTVWFANPYPLLKTLYKDAQLVFQADNPFANAGVFYVQNVRDGDGAAWVLQELNRRVSRFTYHPETVAELPHSSWARAPFFANADEQANLNDIVASSISGEISYAGGIEFPEARFKERFAPRRCFGSFRPGGATAEGCDGVAEARRKMADRSWARSLTEGGAVAAARRKVRRKRPAAKFDPLVHLCQMSSYEGGSEGVLLVPGNASATSGRVVLAPAWLFAHFPYGHFFDAFKQCHATSWDWLQRTPTERRLCMPEHRVPTIMVHMAGLRQESWGRRVMMRAFGVWQEGADAVAPEAWVSARAWEAEAMAPQQNSQARRWAWTATGRLLTAVDVVRPSSFASMQEYDRFAARLLLLGLLLNRRVVMPPIDCSVPYMRKALQARHLRGLEIGCGEDAQCIWLPYPHHIDPWCSGIDFLYDIDYRDARRRHEVEPKDVTEVAVGEVRRAFNATHGERKLRLRALPELHDSRQVLQLNGIADGAGRRLFGGSRAKAPRSENDASSLQDQLAWLPLGGFRTEQWNAPLARRVERYLRAPVRGHGVSANSGLGLSETQVKIVKTCLRSLSTSKE